MDAVGHGYPPRELAEQRRLARRRWILPGLLLALAALAVLAIYVARLPPGLKDGIWATEDGPERLALEFRRARGLVSGIMSQFGPGKKVLEWGFAGTVRRDGTLDLSWGAGVTLEGSADLARGVLEARIAFPDGTSREVTFRRSAGPDVPGYLALPETPYRLRPPAAGSGFEVADPDEVGIDPRVLEKTVRALARGEAGLLHSIVLLRRSRLVLEEYFHGFGRQDLHEIQSCTKSVTSLLVGIAHDRGEIESLDLPVVDFFPQYADLRTAGWEKVTLRHILTMSAGLDWSRRQVRSPSGTGPAGFRKVLARRVVREPGSRWRYVGADVNLLAEVLRQTTGMQADELAARHLFAPLGIERWDWETAKTEGYPSLAGTLELRPLDMAKLGQLVLDEGRWRGEQVVSARWVRESTSPLIETGDGPGAYGYLWSYDQVPLGGTTQELIVATGWGSQFIHVVPGLDIVLVTTGGNHMNGRTFALGEVLARRLVPGID